MAVESDHRTEDEAAVAAVATEYFQAWFAGDGADARRPSPAPREAAPPLTGDGFAGPARGSDGDVGRGHRGRRRNYLRTIRGGHNLRSLRRYRLGDRPFGTSRGVPPHRTVRRALAHRQRSVSRPGVRKGAPDRRGASTV